MFNRCYLAGLTGLAAIGLAQTDLSISKTTQPAQDSPHPFHTHPTNSADRVHSATNAAAVLTQTATNSAPVDLGTFLVEGTPIARYRAETISTATLADARPEEIPQTVDVLTEDFIEEMNPTDLHDLLRYEPGVYSDGKSVLSAAAGTYTIRGKSGSPPMLDGTLPLAGTAMGIFMDPSAFERVEIVKGPVGSISGGQTGSTSGSGGSVNLVLKQPVPNTDFMNVAGRSSFGVDSYRERLNYDLNESVVKDKLTVRLPGDVDYGKPFWMPDSYRWRESYFIAPSVLWEMRDDLRIGFTLSLQYTDQPGYQGIPIYRGKPYKGYDWDSDISTKRMRDVYIGSTAQSYIEWDANKVWTFRTGGGLSQADLEFEHMGSSAYLSATYPKTPYDHQEGDMIYRCYNVFQRGTATFDTGPVKHQMVFQGDFTEKDSDGRMYFAATSNRYEKSLINTKPITRTEVHKYGTLAQDYLSWWKFRLLGGCRFDEHENNNGDTGEAFSPRTGLSFLPTDWLVFFGNVSQTTSPNLGYKKTNTSYLDTDWVSTEYESGVRVSPVSRLWLSTSVFRLDQENMPTAITDTSDPNYSSSETHYEEEGKNQSKGVEFSATGNLADNWSLFAAYAYTEYEDKSPTTAADQRKFDRVPPHALTTSTSYRILNGPFNDIVLGFGYRYRHRYDETMQGKYLGKDYYIAESHVFDCSADIPLYKFGGPKNVMLSFAVKNIFDEEYIESYRHYYQCFPGDPRTFEVALQAKF